MDQLMFSGTELRSVANPLDEFVPAQSERVLLRGFILPEILIKNLQVLYDDCDSDLINSCKWNLSFGWKNSPYATSSKGIMHRLIMDCPKGLLVDHKNHNTLDNRRDNLRICTRSQNMWNRRSFCGSSKYKGVHFNKYHNKFRVSIYLNNERIYLGAFISEVDAALAYDKKARELYGEFAFTNFPLNTESKES